MYDIFDLWKKDLKKSFVTNPLHLPAESLEEKEKHLKEVEADVAALSRRYAVITAFSGNSYSYKLL